MKRWKLMISAPYMQPVPERCRRVLEEHGAEVVVVKVNERLSEQELLEVVADFEAVICGDDRFTERVLLAAPKLKVISKWGTGIDSIDQEACRRLGIAVAIRPTLSASPWRIRSLAISSASPASFLGWIRRCEKENGRRYPVSRWGSVLLA